MWNFDKSACAVGACVASCMTWSAQAGPNFIEGMCAGGDAGSNPSAACEVSGGVGGVATISGSTSLNFGGTADLEDMYLILITDPVGFSVTTTTFDTQLWMFRADPGGALDGIGFLANNDISAIDSGSMLGPMAMSDDGTGVTLTDGGLYYLVVSGGGGPAGGSGRFPVASGLAIFDLVSPTEVSGPDGPGGMFMIDGWAGDGDVGSYTITVEGVSFIEEVACLWDLDGDGVVGIVDFLTLLTNWFNPYGIVEFLDLLANWGPCP